MRLLDSSCRFEPGDHLPGFVIVLVLVAVVLVVVLVATVGAVVVVAGGTDPAVLHPQTPPSAAALAEIPAVLLPRYRTSPACAGLPWQLVAAVGAMVSGHARVGFDPDNGDTRVRIVGPPLDGRGGGAVLVPGGASRWHDDPVWDRRIGPLGFTTAVWSRWGVDASGDGSADPHNAFDAITTAGLVLCDGRPVAGPLDTAVGFLDPDPGFVDAVLDTARRYGMIDGGDPAPLLSVPFVPVDVADGDPGRVVAFVVAQVGKPYVYGTAGPDTFDCSGLVVAAYRSVGVTLPHWSVAQARLGRAVDPTREPVRAGDLVVLPGGTPVTDDGHIGIALDATRYAHAPRTGDVVRVDPLPYPRVTTIRRILNP